MKEYRKELIDRISKCHPSTAPDEFFDFTLRGADMAEIQWNIRMFEDEGLSIDKLRQMTVLMERINNL